MLIAGGSTDVVTYFALRLAADGTAATGLTVTNFDLQYVRSGAAPSTKADATALAATDSSHADNKAIEIDATDQPGLYRVDWPDAAFAAGVREVILTVKCATAFTEHLRVEIDGEVNVVEWAGTDVVAGAIPAAAADAAGGLVISDAGGLDVDTKLANTHEVTAARMGALTDWINGGRLDLLLDLTLADTAELQADWANGGRLDLIVDAILVDTSTTLHDALAVVDGNVDLALADTNELQSDDVPGLIAALNNLSAANVNAQVLDVLNTDTFAESSSVPAATATLVAKIGWLCTLARNKITQTATTTALRNDADGGNISTSTVADDGTTYTRGEWG